MKPHSTHSTPMPTETTKTSSEWPCAAFRERELSDGDRLCPASGGTGTPGQGRASGAGADGILGAGNGDRSENGDYIYGKRRLREIDRRIRYLMKRLESAVVVDPAKQENLDQVFFCCDREHRRP